MMGVLLQCSAILVKEKVCLPSRDELVACLSFWKHEKSLGSFYSTWWQIHKIGCTSGTTVAVLSCPYLLAFSEPHASWRFLLPFFLVQQFRALSVTETIRASFHFKFLLVYTNKSDNDGMKYELAPQEGQRVVTGTYFKFSGWISGPKSWNKLGQLYILQMSTQSSKECWPKSFCKWVSCLFPSLSI